MNSILMLYLHPNQQLHTQSGSAICPLTPMCDCETSLVARFHSFTHQPGVETPRHTQWTYWTNQPVVAKVKKVQLHMCPITAVGNR